MTKRIPPNTVQQSSAAFVPRQTKAALLRARLAEPGGASMTDMMHLTGWQAHTLRAALTGLRKTGVILTRSREGGETIYAIDPDAPAHASHHGVQQGVEAADASPGINANVLAVPPIPPVAPAGCSWGSSC